jgi:hypothetical protein
MRCGNLTLFQWGGSLHDLSTAALPAGTTRIQTAVKDGNNLSLFTDGTLRAGPTPKTAASVLESGIKIGSRMDNAAFFDGYIGEVLLYSGSMSAETRYGIESCLNEKWKAVALPALTPTVTRTPTPTPTPGAESEVGSGEEAMVLSPSGVFGRKLARKPTPTPGPKEATSVRLVPTPTATATATPTPMS